MPLWSSFILLAVGILFIYIEIFVPAGGLIGLAGAGMIIAGVVLGYVYHDAATGTVVLFVSLIATPTAIVLGLKVFPKSPVGRKLILGAPPGGRAGSDDAEAEGPGSQGPGYKGPESDGADVVRPGDEGEAMTVLRPSGTGRFGTRKLSVVTSGEYIERGARIRVTDVQGSRVVVRKL